MSFSSNVKQELCRLPISRRQESAAELYGILLYCNAFTAELIRVTPNPAIWPTACRGS